MIVPKDKFESIIDGRGEIIKIAQNVDVLEIVSKAGVKRAAHWHRRFGHICYLEYGEIEYFERDVDSNVRPIKLIIEPGEYFFTDKNKEHLMKFLVDSWMFCLSFGSRNKENYEEDTVRLDYDLEEIYNSWEE